MIFREALLTDIEGMHVVRMSVKENVLSNPLVVTEAHYSEYLTEKGKGWVCEIENRIVGFSIVDVKGKNIWALFVDPLHEAKGVGSELHDIMLNWFFSNYNETLWLSTSEGTRAQQFYALRGWKETGQDKNGEVKFEMPKNSWLKRA